MISKTSALPNYYDIVILPPKSIYDYAIRLSSAIHKKFGSDLVLGPNRFKPHISLYHVAVRPNRLPEALRELRRIASQMNIGVLRVGAI